MEFYFNTPVVVTDTFRVHYKADSVKRGVRGETYTTHPAIWPPNTFHNGEFVYSGFKHWGGIFPIVVLDQDLVDSTGTTDPADSTGTIDPADTTGVGDNMGIGAPEWMAPIEVAPNPTDGKATVASRVPLRLVEAYDMQGRLLLRQPVEGRTATIDMSGLQPGCYILKIHTATGTAHRKLLVR